MSKKEMIYIRLIEGTISYVPVHAVKIDNLLYQINENKYLDLENDATSIWEYFPGDIVQCEESNGMIIAKKIIKSDFPKRKLHELIFKIVEYMGNIQPKDLPEFAQEINKLIKDPGIIQKNHPIIQEWIKNYK